MPNVRSIKVEGIILDPEIQPRVQMLQSTIDDYAEALKAGRPLPPVVIFRDDIGAMRVADGFNRVMAHKTAGLLTIEAEVHKGCKRDAILYAVGANSEHGQRRTNADKRNAAMRLLDDAEWSQWSDVRIAEQCAVSHQYIGKLRSESCNNSKSTNGHERIGRDGRTQNTANIGKLATVNGHAAPDPPDVAMARARGAIPATAVVEVHEPTEMTDLADTAEAIAEEAAQAADALSDDDWLAELPLTTVLKGTQLKTFRADAILYRLMEQPRSTFRHHAARAMKGRDKGDYAWRLRRFLKTDHPKSWLRCPTTENGGCGGTGVIPIYGECPKCRGKGYWVNS